MGALVSITVIIPFLMLNLSQCSLKWLGWDHFRGTCFDINLATRPHTHPATHALTHPSTVYGGKTVRLSDFWRVHYHRFPTLSPHLRSRYDGSSAKLGVGMARWRMTSHSVLLANWGRGWSFKLQTQWVVNSWHEHLPILKFGLTGDHFNLKFQAFSMADAEPSHVPPLAPKQKLDSSSAHLAGGA